MNKTNNTKDKQKLVFYTVAGGYLLYQGITLMDSLLKKGSPFSKDFILYIFSGIFILCGAIIMFYVLKGYKKNMDEMKNTHTTDSSDELEYNDGSDEKDGSDDKDGSEVKDKSDVEDEMQESLEESEKHLKEEGKKND